MSQPHDRVFNFSAGPSTLPVPVLERAREGLLNWEGAGMGVMEMSHRGKAFESILAQAKADLAELLGVPAGYQILFLQGGASLQFTMAAMNFLPAGGRAAYVVTGTWGKKAVESAALHGRADVAWDGKPTKYDRVPALRSLDYGDAPAFVHVTGNETIQGVDFLDDPDLDVPVIADLSSNILSRPIDVSKYAMIYAGAQKNMGPAGATLVIVSDRLLERVPAGLPPMLDYRLQAENDSLYNTPPCWTIYVCGLVYAYLKERGGLAAQAALNEAKAKLVYDAIDASGGFYRGHAQVDCRSRMNVTFTLPDEELTEAFLKGAKAHRLDGLKGHRSVGGCRASIYNAFPIEGCQALADYMADFRARHSG